MESILQYVGETKQEYVQIDSKKDIWISIILKVMRHVVLDEEESFEDWKQLIEIVHATILATERKQEWHPLTVLFAALYDDPQFKFVERRRRNKILIRSFILPVDWDKYQMELQSKGKAKYELRQFFELDLDTTDTAKSKQKLRRFNFKEELKKNKSTKLDVRPICSQQIIVRQETEKENKSKRFMKKTMKDYFQKSRGH